jgi:uncharacterized protein
MAVGLTGVGAGTITAPVLIVFFGLPAAESVGTALAFTAVIKFAVAPIYLFRRQVNKRILLFLCAGGIPGVVAGVVLLSALDTKRYEGTIFLVIGITVAVTAIYSLINSIRAKVSFDRTDRSGWLPAIACGIGAEVGFSSAGAGALGSLALLNLTPLRPAQVIGTDMLFGLVLSLVGGGLHLSEGHYNGALLWKLIAGGLVGAFAGANLSAMLPSRPLRVALSLWLSCVGFQLCWRAL